MLMRSSKPAATDNWRSVRTGGNRIPTLAGIRNAE